MKKVLLVAVSVLLVCTSCVTKKKYLLAENGRLEAIARGDDLQNQLVNCRDNNDGLTSRLASLERDTTRMGKNIRNYQSMLNTNMTELPLFLSKVTDKFNKKQASFLVKTLIPAGFRPPSARYRDPGIRGTEIRVSKRIDR